jgi:D-3-phosphoglycerate dehydrogenase
LKVLITEAISPSGLTRLRQELAVDVKENLSREQLLSCIAAYDGIVVRSGTRLDREMLEKAARLKVVGRAGTGVDNIDVAAATQLGILVVNAPESNTLSAAEHTIALMMSLLRHIPRASRLLQEGRWDRKGFRGQEAYGKCLGIIGLGRIGSLVSRMAQALGMTVIAYDPYISRERFGRFGAEQVTNLDDLCRRADIITVHTPKTDETYGMLGAREFALMRSGVRIINCARGGIVDEKALYQALTKGQVAGAGLDVFDHEPCHDNALCRLDDVICTPHLGGSTREALERVGRDIAEEVIRGLRGDLVQYPLNFPSTDPRLQTFIKPFLILAERMGRFSTQLFKPHIDELEIEYGGEISRYNTDLVRAAMLQGLLSPILEGQVNMINAGTLAAQRGIRIKESRIEEIEDYANFLSLTVAGHQIRGTVFGRNDSRIIGIDDFKLDVVPHGPILISWHEASHTRQPGVIGQIGSVLGASRVNIHRIEVGNSEQGLRAMLVLNLDDMPPEGIVETILQTPGVLDARMILL